MKNLFMGLTLAYFTREKGEYLAEFPSFPVKRQKNYQDTLKLANSIGKKGNFGNVSSDKDFSLYLGVKDIFYVAGPMSHGALMGQTSKLSYRSLEKAKTLLSRHNNKFANYYKKGTCNNLYLAEIIYFYGEGVPYKYKRSIACLGIVYSKDKNKVKSKAKVLGQSDEFKNKIRIRDYDKKLSSVPLKYVGIAYIGPIFEELKCNHYYDMSYNKLSGPSAVKKIILPDKRKLKAAIKQLNKW